jgi:DivIVA domain-containing protein
MTDDSFQLMPHDVRAQQFARAMRGYAPVEVDEFKNRVAEAMDRMLRDKLQAEERLRSALEQLKAYREREHALNEALVAAQQLRTDSRAQAEREAELVLREARAEGERIIERSAVEERRVRERADAAARQFSAYVAGFRSLLQRQLAELEVLEGHSRTIVEVQAEALERAAR